MKKLRIFVSSVQKELAAERRAVKNFILNDALLSRFAESVFLFEDLPAADRLPDDIYLSEVEACDVYLAILGNEYGGKNADGLSPTELEFDCATRSHRERLVFVKGETDAGRDPDMTRLLREPHGPLPRNPLIAEPLFRTKYVEKAGTGTTDMIADCLEAGLPEPDFAQHGPHFVTTIWRDWLTEDVLAGLGLNERQLKAVKYLKTEHQITNAEYQDVAKVAKRTAHRDLAELVEKGILKKIGTRGKGTHYLLSRNRVTNGPIGPSEAG